MKPVLILFGTHGDEFILRQCLSYIDPNLSFLYDTLNVNEQAIGKNVRYIKHDMNRIAPGDFDSNDYETKRSSEVQEIMKQYEIVIDIHGTKSNTGSFIILPKVNLSNLMMASLFESENIVFWQSEVRKEVGPVTQFCPIGMEIETGPMNEIMIEKLGRNIEIFLKNFQLRYSYKEMFNKIKSKNVFSVSARLDTEVNIDIPDKDFEMVNIDNVEYYTLLTNNPYKTTKCYLMKAVDIDNLLITPLDDANAFIKDIISIEQ